MAKKLEYQIGVDASQGISGVKDFSRAVSKELKNVEDDFDDTSTAGEKVATVLSAMARDLDDELGRAAQASEALKTALGEDLAGRADIGEVIGGLQKMGLTFEDITQDADKLAVALKEMDEVQLKGVNSGLAGVSTKMGDVGKSADSSKSVLANMVGNASQDLSSLTGIAGSAGVAIGQMGEYMADAIGSGESFGSVLKSFAAVAGPIAAISAAIGVITSVTAEFKAEEDAAKKRVDAFTAALDKQGDTVDNLAEAMQQGSDDMREVVATSGDFADIFSEGFGSVARGLPLFSELVGKGVDVVDLLDELNLSFKDVAGAAGGTWEQWRKWKDTIDDALASGKISKDQHEALTKVMIQQVDALAKANAARRALLPIQVDQAQNEARLAAEEKARADHLDAYNQAQQTAAEGAQAFSDALASTDYKTADLNAAVTAMGKFNSRAFALSNMAQDVEESFAALGDTLVKSTEKGEKRIALTGDVATEAGRAQQDAIEGVAKALELQFASAYDKAGDSIENFRTSAADIGDNTLKKLRDEFKLTAPEVALLRDQLNLTAKDYEARFELAGAEEAQLKLDLLSTSIDDLPKDVKTTVTQQIIQGDYVGALKTIQDHYDNNPLNIALNITPQYPSGWHWVGGQLVPGPQSVNPMPPGPMPVMVGAAPTTTASMSATVPVAVVPAATSQRPVVYNINQVFQTGVMGAPFDVSRAVEDANRRTLRLMPKVP